jgi:phosphoribosylformylglycinamidine cyclo-ligase
MSEDAYAEAGVSQRDADSAVEALVRSLKLIETGKPSRVVPLPGHYASVLRVEGNLAIAIGTDGVGTKMIVAERLGRFETIGIDCVAMNVNDVICVGAEPLAMVDFILCKRADPDICGQIGVGLRRGAELAGIEIPGGEIAQVGDVVSGWELGGTAIGIVDTNEIVDGGRIEAGDALIGLPSSGLHSNGYTLARSALDDLSLDDDRLGRPLGEILLEPTEIYVRAVRDLLGSSADIRGLAHITGDGLNNLRRLAAPVGYEIDDPLPVPPIFGLIAELGEVPEDEMHEVCVVAERDVDDAVEMLRGHYPDAKRIGSATERHGVVERAPAG